MAISPASSETHSQPSKPPSIFLEVETATCESCGFTEECTRAYILKIRERYQGRWICGLCIEAVKDEVLRSSDDRLISIDEALNRHISFCQKFRKSNNTIPLNNHQTEHPIAAMGRVLRKSLDSPRAALRPSASTSSLRRMETAVSGLVRSGSCFSSLSN